MSDIVPRSTTSLTPLQRRTSRELAHVQHRMLVRVANVQAEGLVQAEKLHEIDHLTREAMTGHTVLTRWRDLLASGDPFLADELKLFTDTARLGKGEVLADTIDSFCRESRR